jgi:5-(aminomethyl)-3-furanmethanol phosphate kinase
LNSQAPLTVIKLGGSLAFSPSLKDWLAAIASCAGHVVLVPGGGPFADAVRRSQDVMGFGDAAAHRMALLAMEQYGRALAALADGLIPAGSMAEIQRVLQEHKVPVWSPAAMAQDAEDIPPSWEVTSDSLAAWLAGKLGATHVLLVKQIRPAATSLRLDALVAQGVVDPLCGHFLAASGAAAALAGPTDHAAAAAAIRKGEPPGIPIDLR